MPRKHTQTTHTPFSWQNGVVICKAKRRFPSKLAAERAAELKNLEDTSLALTIYHCDQCKKWHLTRLQGRAS